MGREGGTADGVRQPRGVGSIDQGGRILRTFVRARSPLMLREVADALGTAPASLHPYLVSLRRLGLVEQTEAGLYQLGPFALQLGLARLRAQDAFREAIARAPLWADRLSAMVTLSTWGPHGVSIFFVQEHAERLHANVRVGGLYEMTTTATGRVFAAFLAPETTRPVIEREFATARGAPTAAGDYARSVALARARGWQDTRDVPIPGVSAVAAPVFDHTGALQLCVTAIGATGVIDLSPEGPVVRGLLAATEALSCDLGHDGAAGQALAPDM